MVGTLVSRTRTSIASASEAYSRIHLRWPGRNAPVLAGVSAACALAALLFWLLHEALIDDAYITLTYARNLAFHLHWGLLPDQVSNTATSPLNVLVLGAVTFVVRRPVDALGLVYIANAAALTFGLVKLGESTGLGRHFAWVAAPLLLLNPLLASTLGMETNLAISVLVFLAVSAARGNARWFGIVGGLAVLTRIDLAIFVAVLFLARPLLWRAIHRAAAWFALVVVPWFAFSWVVLGSAVPDTLILKQEADWGAFARDLVMYYGKAQPWAVMGTVVVPALGVLALLAWPWWRRAAWLHRTGVIAAFGLAGGAYFGAYTLLGFAPYLWYYGPTLAALTICCAAVVPLLVSSLSTRTRAAALAGVAALLVLPAGAGWVARAQESVPFTHALVHGNWARPAQYTHIAYEVRATVGDATVRSPFEIGTLLYHCRCHMVDKFSDRGRLADLIAERERSSFLWRLNYLFLDPDELVVDVEDYRMSWSPRSDSSGRSWNVYGPFRGKGQIELHKVPDEHSPDLPASSSLGSADAGGR